jgi:uncharacterized membrane protein YeaQ/YmgE (transglycosylase-associated protein family)
MNVIFSYVMKKCTAGGKTLELLYSILIGFVAGAIAKFIMPGKDPGGLIVTILLGIGGSVLFSWLGRTLGFYNFGDRAGLLGAVIGALIILWLYRIIRSR